MENNSSYKNILPLSNQQWSGDEPIMVSVVVATYNHEKYIAQTIDGILMQETNFRVEILVNDDASTDSTAQIVKEYNREYPQLFRNFYQPENQYSKGVKPWIDILFPIAKGKYIAICEGDDYWTDPLKLQKQVDFLEEHPEYSMVCGGFKSVNTVTGEEITAIKDVENSIDNTEQGFDITLERFFKQWLTKTLTLVYRTELYNPNDFKDYKYTKDVHLNYHLLKRGKGYYMKEVFGVYHIHEGGVFSNNSRDAINIDNYIVIKDLYLKDKKSPLLRQRFKKSIHRIIHDKLYKNNKVDKKLLLLELFKLIETKQEFMNFLKSFYSIIKNKSKIN